MSDRPFYQDQIMEHAQRPRNYGAAKAPTRQRVGFNPLCGDEITLFFGASADAPELSFVAKGCALCRASASLMTENSRQILPSAWESWIEGFRSAFGAATRGERFAATPGLEALFDVAPFASRARCVLLPWNTLREMLDD